MKQLGSGSDAQEGEEVDESQCSQRWMKNRANSENLY